VAVLVTRPAPDNAATAEALRKRGFEPMLAPMLVFQALPFQIDASRDFRGLILTSINALRAIAAHPLSRLQGLPAFAVGARTAQAAREAGFRDVRTADGDAVSLRELIAASAPERRGRAPLLYLCATDVSRDLGGELGLRGVNIVAVPVYRMARLDDFTDAVRTAFARQGIEAVLHYSRRSALAFIAATRRAGLEISALALPQLCLSETIAATLREAGADRPIVAKTPTEPDLLDALEHVLQAKR
jgi:uroporphyrinogen-III synthase